MTDQTNNFVRTRVNQMLAKERAQQQAQQQAQQRRQAQQPAPADEAQEPSLGDIVRASSANIELLDFGGGDPQND